MGIRRRAVVGLLGALIVGAVSACATGAGASASGPSTHVAASSPSPTPTVKTTGTIVLGPQKTEILDADGAVTATITYDEDPRIVMKTLVAAIGADPAPDTDPSSPDVWGLGGAFFSWKGLTMSLYETNGPGAEGQGQSIFQLIADATTVGPLAIEGPSHVRVGDSEESVRKLADPKANPNSEPTTISLADWTRPGIDPADGKTPMDFTDWVDADTKDGRVVYLRATSFNYGS